MGALANNRATMQTTKISRLVGTASGGATGARAALRALGVLGALSAAVMTAALFAADAAASSLLTLGPRGVQSLVSEQFFNRSGRWYLIDDGACHTYLESPRTRLENDRLVLNAHLTSRLGQRIGNGCAGADLASNVTLSGRLRGSGHTLMLDDIRIDHVEDDATRDALNLALQLVPDMVPRTASINVLELMRSQVLPNGALGAHLDEVRIANLTTRPGAVTITFDLSLSTP